MHAQYGCRRVLHLVGDNRFETKCTACMRASPVLPGPLEEAVTALKRLNWAHAMDAQWYCPVCTTRRTTKQRRFE
jgi:hypothetical protein